MDNNKITNINKDCILPCIKRLSIQNNELQQFGGITEWKTLEFINLNDNKLKGIPKEIKNLNLLKRLRLSNNEIEIMSDEIGELSELKELQLFNNKIKTIPLSIGNLVKLEILDLSKNQISNLPLTLGYLEKLETWKINDNPLISPPIEIAITWKDLIGYFEDLLKGSKKCNFLKLIIVSKFYLEILFKEEKNYLNNKFFLNNFD